MTLICVIGCMLTVYSVFALDSPKSHGNSSEAQDNFRKEINIQTCEKIATEYYGSHTYTEDGIYDCDDMAQDVWNMLKAKGIKRLFIIFWSCIDCSQLLVKLMVNFGNPRRY